MGSMKVMKSPMTTEWVIKEFLLDEMGFSLRYDTMDVPVLVECENGQDKINWSLEIGKQARLYSENGYAYLPKMIEDRLMNSFLHEERFSEVRSQLENYANALLFPKPELQLEILAHEILEIDELHVEFRILNPSFPIQTSDITYFGENWEKWDTDVTESPYLGFRDDIEKLVRQKMKLVFLLEKGE